MDCQPKYYEFVCEECARDIYRIKTDDAKRVNMGHLQTLKMRSVCDAGEEMSGDLGSRIRKCDDGKISISGGFCTDYS